MAKSPVAVVGRWEGHRSGRNQRFHNKNISSQSKIYFLSGLFSGDFRPLKNNLEKNNSRGWAIVVWPIKKKPFDFRDWNSKHYIEPPGDVHDKEKELQELEEDVIDDDRRNREASGLVRTGRLFGGLINDIKRKTPHYLSDFKVSS